MEDAFRCINLGGELSRLSCSDFIFLIDATHNFAGQIGTELDSDYLIIRMSLAQLAIRIKTHIVVTSDSQGCAPCSLLEHATRELAPARARIAALNEKPNREKKITRRERKELRAIDKVN